MSLTEGLSKSGPFRFRCFHFDALRSYDAIGRNYVYALDPWYLKKHWRACYRRMFPSAASETVGDVEERIVVESPRFCVDSFRVGNVRARGIYTPHWLGD